MATKPQLVEQIEELAARLGIDCPAVSAETMKSTELGAIVKDLKAKIRDKENVTIVDEVTSEQPKEKVPDAPVKVPAGVAYKVAKGKSIICKKDILSEGDEVRPEYLGGGQAALDVLVKNQVVRKRV